MCIRDRYIWGVLCMTGIEGTYDFWRDEMGFQHRGSAADKGGRSQVTVLWEGRKRGGSHQFDTEKAPDSMDR